MTLRAITLTNAQHPRAPAYPPTNPTAGQHGSRRPPAPTTTSGRPAHLNSDRPSAIRPSRLPENSDEKSTWQRQEKKRKFNDNHSHPHDYDARMRRLFRPVGQRRVCAKSVVPMSQVRGDRARGLPAIFRCWGGVCGARGRGQ